ncbi:MAG TPA: 6-phosphogluconolactonase [Candidatus Saccharimonadales bacterium]
MAQSYHTKKLTIVPSLAEPVGGLWRDLQAKYTRTGNFYVASPLSSTPLPVYEWIVANAATFVNWNKTRFVLMDEQVEGDRPPFSYIATTDQASYERFAKEKLLRPLARKVSLAKEAILKPDLNDPADFNPTIDLLVLALGVKGNYANVMPGTPINTGWHVAHLIPGFRQAHTRKGSNSYEGARFREFGMSLGSQQVLRAKHVAVIISGKAKRPLVEQLLAYDTFDPVFPLSIVHHPEVIRRVRFYVTEDVFA